ncbi:polyubiquitin-C-like [Argopecten irradians]|uniref:polyubiquitin-C-like n=1 Tax=Argopecten irradians TaxID=31199 RepID=UPI003713607E
MERAHDKGTFPPLNNNLTAYGMFPRPTHDMAKQREHHDYFLQPFQENDEYDSESYSDDSFDDNILYPILSVPGTNGQSIGVWSYLKFESIAIFSPSSGDTMQKIVKYAEQNLSYQRDQHKLMMLAPGQLSPIDIKTVYSVRPGSVIMILPESYAFVTVDIGQLNASFTLTVDLTMTVYKIKSLVKKMKGIPIDRQEILYRDKALENYHRLLEYRVTNKCTLYVMIQAHFDLLINIETFWGKTYRFYVDPCCTGTDVIYTVFNRTFSRGRPEDAGIHELYVPIHALVLQYRNSFVNSDYCLAYLGIPTGDTLTLTTVGHRSNLNLQSISVVTESGERYGITVSKYDRWSILAFMLHGLTNVPVDLIRLYKDSQRMELSSVIGDLPNNTIVMMNIVLTHMDSDLVFGVPLRVNLGHGIIENIRVTPNKTIKSVKKKLERLGVPNATQYELVTGNKKLVNKALVQNVVLDVKSPLLLQLDTFPVFAHTADGIIYKTNANVRQTIGEFKKKIQEKSSHSMSSCRIIMAGEELSGKDTSNLYEAGVNVKSSLFIKTNHSTHCFFIVGNNWMVKVRVPVRPTSDDIRQSIWETKKVPESSMNCILTLLHWFFMPRMSGKNFVPVQRRIKKRMPVAKESLIPMTESELAIETDYMLEKRKERFHPVVLSAAHSVHSKEGEVTSRSLNNNAFASTLIQTHVRPQFEPTQFLDHKDHNSTQGDKGKPHTNYRKDNGLGVIPRLKNPPWVGDLQRKNKANRLNLSDFDNAPEFMFSNSKKKKPQFEARSVPERLPGILQCDPNRHNHPHRFKGSRSHHNPHTHRKAGSDGDAGERVFLTKPFKLVDLSPKRKRRV